jgi:hypothetical protein
LVFGVVEFKLVKSSKEQQKKAGAMAEWREVGVSWDRGALSQGILLKMESV